MLSIYNFFKKKQWVLSEETAKKCFEAHLTIFWGKGAPQDVSQD